MRHARFRTLAPLVLAAACAAAPCLGADIVKGGEVYQKHCARCHGSTGISAWPMAPNLARREGLMQADQALLATLRKGRGAKPGFQGMLSDAEILDVIAYARTLAR